MKKIFLAFCFVFLLSFSVYAEENRAYFPPVLMYHDIKVVARDKFDVLLEDFCEQLDWLKENNYETLSMEDFISYVKEGKNFPEKSVLITFDDGYNGIYNYVAPELKKRNMKATFVIITNMLGIFSTRYAHITSLQLKELADNELFSIGSHTLSHADFSKITEEEIKKEIEASKKFLENLTGRKILAFAYPYGNYDKKIIDEVKNAGYEAAFVVNDKGLCGQKARYSIPRIYMGLDLCKNNQELFKTYVQTYKDMPPEAFAERFQPLSSDVEWYGKISSDLTRGE